MAGGELTHYPWRKRLVKIHPTAIVDPQAKIGENVEIGPYSVIAGDVIIGDDCKIKSHVFIDAGTRLGKGIVVAKGAVLGTEPQDLKYNGEKTFLEIGDFTRIREFVTLNRGTIHSYKTVIGESCLIMAYAHVAHDCVIGNHVIIANAVNMGGHVVIGDYAGIGGVTAIHQFVHIGQHSYIGGGLRVTKDVPPFVLAMGEPLRYGGTNFVGLSRRGFRNETILEIKRAYRFVYQSRVPLKEVLIKIEQELRPLPEIKAIVEFIRHSERGIIPR